jgi:hypothetical protein
MGRLFASASSQALSKNSWAGTLNYPFSFGCWIKATTVAVTQLILMIDTTSSSGDYASIYADTSNKIRAGWQGSAYQEAISVASITAGTWHHVLSVGASATVKNLYLDGVAVAQANSVPMGGTFNKQTIAGAYGGSATITNFFNGVIAFPAYWTVALSAADIAALFAGVGPKKVQPSFLVSYAPLTGNASPEPDIISATPWTLTGTPTESANPLILCP